MCCCSGHAVGEELAAVLNVHVIGTVALRPRALTPRSARPAGRPHRSGIDGRARGRLSGLTFSSHRHWLVLPHRLPSDLFRRDHCRSDLAKASSVETMKGGDGNR
jgi:hypothetical protein